MPSTPFRDDRPILIGMVHLQPLPGSPRFGGSMAAVIEAARRDAAALVEGGVDAVMVENFGDVPFFAQEVPPITLAGVTAAVVKVQEVLPADIGLGVNVLRNDGRAAVAVAAATGAGFVRINVLCGARVTDQGVIEGNAANVLRDRRSFGIEGCQVWADIDVKHSAPLARRPLSEEVSDTLNRGLADALIVSGGGTGLPTDPAKVREVCEVACDRVPVLIGSGVNPDAARDLLIHASGLIAGTWVKQEGRVERPVDARRVRQLAEVVAG